MGWGLKTLEFVAKGRLVIEYIGEVIAEREMQVCPFASRSVFDVIAAGTHDSSAR